MHHVNGKRKVVAYMDYYVKPQKLTITICGAIVCSYNKVYMTLCLLYTLMQQAS